MKDYPDNMGKPLAKVFVVAGVLIEKDGKYLMLQEKQKKAYMLWNFPGGKVDEDESLEQAAVREAKEESGFEVEIGKGHHIFHDSMESPVIHTYMANIVGGELIVSEDEIMDAGWFTVEEIFSMKDKLRNADRMLGALETLTR